MSLNALLLLLVVPIAVVGWRWGTWPAWSAAATAMALVAARGVAGNSDLGAIGYVGRATVFATVAVLASALHRSTRPAVAPVSSNGMLDDVLTKRELEVLARMAEGETNAEIAAGLVVAESTVKSHVKNILRKLDAANRTEAVGLYFGARDESPS